MRWRCCLLALVAAIILLPAPVVWAQLDEPRLNSELQRKSEPLNDTEKASLRQYIQFWVQRLAAGEDISAARTKLTDPVRSTNSSVFVRAYAVELANLLIDAVNNQDPLTRINLMIVAHSIPDEGVVAALLQGLSDSNPAVRYWAAKGVASLAAAVEIDPAVQQRMVDPLVSALESETSEIVLEQLSRGLASLTAPAAEQAMMTWLNRRAGHHEHIKELSILPDLAGLQPMFLRIVRRAVAAKDVKDEDKRRIAIVAAKYLDASAAVWDGGATSPVEEQGHRRMMALCENIMRWAVGQLAPNSPVPSELESVLKNGAKAMARLVAKEWKDTLGRPPINATAGDWQLLELKAPARQG